MDSVNKTQNYSVVEQELFQVFATKHYEDVNLRWGVQFLAYFLR